MLSSLRSRIVLVFDDTGYIGKIVCWKRLVFEAGLDDGRMTMRTVLLGSG
jgi:ribosomal protein S28E/S33